LTHICRFLGEIAGRREFPLLTRDDKFPSLIRERKPTISNLRIYPAIVMSFFFNAFNFRKLPVFSGKCLIVVKPIFNSFG